MPARINSQLSSETLSAILFLLLFPGFYFYHQGLAAGLIPGVMGGFFSPICVLALAIYLPFWKYWIRMFSRAPGYTYLIIFFFIWTMLSAFLTYWLYPESFGFEALYQYMNAALTWAGLLLLGMGVGFNNKWFRCLLWGAGGATFLMLANYVATTGSLQYYAANLYDVDEGVVSYQGFARSALLLSFSLLALSRSLKTQAIVAVFSVFVLFVLAARSEFAATIICLALLFIMRSGKEKKRLIAAFLICIPLLIVALKFQQDLLETRQARMLDLSSDRSWLAREEKVVDAWFRVKESPLFGQFGGHFESGGVGSYAHNIISVWDSFGLVGFSIFLLLIAIPAMDAMRSIVKMDDMDPYHTFYFLVSISSFILLLTSKSYFWPVPALAWGLYIGKQRFYGRFDKSGAPD